ncbi:hypothetical protein LguiA_029779 [Lonicera macranthoides]
MQLILKAVSLSGLVFSSLQFFPSYALSTRALQTLSPSPSTTLYAIPNSTYSTPQLVKLKDLSSKKLIVEGFIEPVEVGTIVHHRRILEFERKVNVVRILGDDSESLYLDVQGCATTIGEVLSGFVIWSKVRKISSLIVKDKKVKKEHVWNSKGDGKDTYVFKDLWILSPDDPFVLTSPPPLLHNATVNSLMSSSHVGWDNDVLNDILSSRDASLVRQITLSLNNKQDGWFWSIDLRGYYTVKSGYRNLVGSYLQLVQPDQSIGWSNVWRIQVPPQTKNFLWRLLSNCLPTRLAIALRHVDVPLECPVCNLEVESAFHVLVSCPIAKGLWSLSSVGVISGLVGLVRD